MKKNGFTLIELIVLLVIIGIAFSVGFGIYKAGGGESSINCGESSINFGINGITETRCIGGYKFIVGNGGQARQIMDSYGKGIPCN